MDCIELSMRNKAKHSQTVDLQTPSTDTPEPSKKSSTEYESQISNLEAENRVLLAQISALSSSQQTTTESLTITNESTGATAMAATTATTTTTTESIELRQKLELSERTVDLLREQVRDLGLKLAEMTGLYESAKQAELDEKNKLKHLDRSIRALKIEKGNPLIIRSSPT